MNTTIHERRWITPSPRWQTSSEAFKNLRFDDEDDDFDWDDNDT